jgi:hypothetical protein
MGSGGAFLVNLIGQILDKVISKLNRKEQSPSMGDTASPADTRCTCGHWLGGIVIDPSRTIRGFWGHGLEIASRLDLLQ